MRLKYQRSIVGGLAVGCVALVAGCGGGSSSSTLTPEEYRTQADAICTTFDAVEEATAEPTSAETVAPYLAALIPAAQKQTADLKALKVPEELKAKHDEAISLQEQQLTLITDAKTRIDGGESAVTVITEVDSKVSPLTDRSDVLAEELGLKVCGDGDDTTTTTTSTTAAPPAQTTLTTDTAPADTTDAVTEAAPTGEVDATVFASDTQKLGGNLTQFGLTLQAAAQGPAALAERSTLLRSQLDEFDAIIGRMGGYTVSTPQFETKRAAIVAAGPDVTSSGRELLDAADAGDATKLNSVLPTFVKALSTLQTAATG